MNEIWKNYQLVRERAPLVHNVTNYVVMNNTANALLAAGASPVMAHAVEEVEEMVNIASALVINIGTLDATWVRAMERAMLRCKQLQKPIIFDPVGVGATSYRNQVAEHLLKIAPPSVIRGNASEVMALAGARGGTKGVDSTKNALSAVDAAHEVSNKTQGIVCVSGEVDIVIGNELEARLFNGHALMPKVTGLGCTVSALIGAFAGVTNNHFMATVSAVSILNIAAELAAVHAEGPATLQLKLIDKLYTLKEQEFKDLLKIDFNV